MDRSASELAARSEQTSISIQRRTTPFLGDDSRSGPLHPDGSFNRLRRRYLSGALRLAGTLAAPCAAWAQGSYPDKAVRVVVGFPAGTGRDFVARLISQKFNESLKQGFVVDNKAGAGGQIGAQELTRTPADGYTIYLGTVAEMGIAPNSYTRLPYDPHRDFLPIGHVASADFAFVVPQAHPARTIKEYADWMKRRTDLAPVRRSA